MSTELLNFHKSHILRSSLLTYEIYKLKIVNKINTEYSNVKNKTLSSITEKKIEKDNNKTYDNIKSTTSREESKVEITDVQEDDYKDQSITKIIDNISEDSEIKRSSSSQSRALIISNQPQSKSQEAVSQALAIRNKPFIPNPPEWHAPWKISKVISGHLGWVRCISVDPSNEWFVTGSADRMIKIWDLASGTLKLSLTGHINAVRGVVVSPRHPYLFSVGEDKAVKCWDLEYNKVIRSYHGHLSGVYCVDLHPTLDVLVTGGRDSSARVWDIRTKACVHTLAGHTSTIASVKCQNAEPQIITGSHDSTIRLWDLAAGKSVVTLTNHKKSVRDVLIHPTEYSFASASTDNIKVWKCPEGMFLRNMEGHNAVVNCLAINQDNVMVSGADNGSMCFWDWSSGHCFQNIDFITPQPGSMDSESGVFACAFDKTGSRLITCEADKTIKIWKEDELATPETHPLNWRADKKRKKY